MEILVINKEDCFAAPKAFVMQTWFSAFGLACWIGAVLCKKSVQLELSSPEV